jgi:hypothetical protein
MIESDFSGLSVHTQCFSERIHRDELDQVRSRGRLVMLALCAGAPDTKSKIGELFHKLNLVHPVDCTLDIDEVVERIYEGYDRKKSEICYRFVSNPALN